MKESNLKHYMKIGILTQPLQTNYGGLLQNWALQTVLKKNGHDVETIVVKKERSYFRKIASSIKRRLVKMFFKPNDTTRYYPTEKEMSVIGQHTNKFTRKHISHIIVRLSTEDLTKWIEKNKYEALIVGSDQVWRPCYNSDLFLMYLNFAESLNIKKLTYAASFGASEWEYNDFQTSVCSRLIQQFNLVTVRESSGVELCKKYLRANATQVIDPTLLLDRSEYEKLIVDESAKSNNADLFYYILDPCEEKLSIINNISTTMHFSAFTVLPKYQAENRTQKTVWEHIDDCVYPPVSKWLSAFRDARMIVGDSFHCAVFSIIFNKPFWIINNQERGSARFDTLLKTFQLEDRLISSNQTNVDWQQPIEWKVVNEIWNSERERCLTLLKSGLN